MRITRAALRHGILTGGAAWLMLALLPGCSSPPWTVADGPGALLGELTPERLAARAGAARDPALPLERIAFGSCSRTDLPQPMWAPIADARPDLWVWLGDNVYADTDDMHVMRRRYEEALSNPGYASLLRSMPVMGTWDDHDFGKNNAGAGYSQREASQKEMLDFLGEPRDSPRRARAGVYTSASYGEAPHKTKLILLDARYHREDPGPGSTILGEAQWRWLERELTHSDAQIHLIGGGIQFLAVDHRFEKWADFAEERARLLELIGRSGAPGVLLLSGDRHMSEIMRVEDPALAYPLWEVTSSGLTHSWSRNPGEPNRHRVGGLVTVLSFGLIAIDWETQALQIELRDESGAAVESRTIPLAELRADDNATSGTGP